MKRLRIVLLVHDDLVPPERCEADHAHEPWRMEYDVLAGLRRLGHDVRVLGVCRDLLAVDELRRQWQPHVVFNLLEDVYGVIAYDHDMTACLELLGLAYTGCNPLGLAVSRDKALSKKLLTYHRIRVPKFIVCRRGRRTRRPKRLGFPLIVKPLLEDASAGISQRSVVHDDAELARRVAYVHERRDGDAIVEQFIGGRELYVGVLGNERLEVLPPWELLIEGRPPDAPLLATRKVKLDPAYQKKMGVVSRRAEDLPVELAAGLARISRRACRALQLSGYARLDFRLDAAGQPYLLEANANPQLARGEDFAESAKAAGIGYEKLLERILRLGLRWKETHEII